MGENEQQESKLLQVPFSLENACQRLRTYPSLPSWLDRQIRPYVGASILDS
jgi:hypothetical protein